MHGTYYKLFANKNACVALCSNHMLLVVPSMICFTRFVQLSGFISMVRYEPMKILTVPIKPVDFCECKCLGLLMKFQEDRAFSLLRP